MLQKPPPDLGATLLRERVRLELVGALEERRVEPAVLRQILLDELLYPLGLGSFLLWLVGALVRHAVAVERDVDGRLLQALAPNAHHLVLVSLVEKNDGRLASRD